MASELKSTNLFISEARNVVNLGSSKSDWKVSETEITQSSKTGEKRPASGTMLLFSPAVTAAPLIGLRANAAIASSYYTGIAFNYRNKRNFCLFTVNRGAGKNPGYSMEVAEVVQGDYNIKCKEKHPNKQGNDFFFMLKNTPEGLLFFLNNNEVFRWNQAWCDSSCPLGFYSQQNDDAVFRELLITNADEMNVNSDSRPNGHSKNVTSNHALDSGMKNNSSEGLLKYLSIQPPQSRTLINFTNVLTVPLDSFYEALYKNPAINKKEEIQTPDGSMVFKLDFRPRRWYKDYKKLYDLDKSIVTDEKMLAKKQAFLEKKIEMLENPDSEEFEKLFAALQKTRIGRSTVIDTLHEVRDRKADLLREIRTNGFTLVEPTTVDPILEKGYNFHIKGSTVNVANYSPLPINPAWDLAKDSDWTVVDTGLQKRLLDSGALSPSQRDDFAQQSKSLTNVESNPKLSKELNEMQAKVESLSKQIVPLNSQAIDNEIALWKADKKLLLAEKIKYPEQYYPEDFPSSRKNPTTINYIDPYFTDRSHPSYLKNFYQWLICLNHLEGKPDPSIYTYDGSLPTKYLTKADAKIHPVLADLIKEFFWPQYQQQNAFYARNFNKLRTGIGTKGGGGVDLNFVGLNYPELNVDYFLLCSVSSQTPDKSPDIFYTYTWRGDRSIANFFNNAIKVCDHYIDLYAAQKQSVINNNAKLQIEINLLNESIEYLKSNGLKAERINFLNYWNNPEAIGVSTIETNIIYPDIDPLADLLTNLSGGESNAIKYKTHFFNFSGDAFYNNDGQSIPEFLKSLKAYKRDVVAVLPDFAKNGKFSEETVTAVVNPVATLASPELPIIKFVETYQLQVVWKGYVLGELSHSFNLFPGETKELVIEKTSRLKKTESSSSKQESSSASKTSSSFEDNLSQEFSTADRSSDTTTNKVTQQNKQTSSTEETEREQDTSKFSLSYPGIPGMSGGPGFSNESSSEWKKTRNNALEASQNSETQKANNQSKEVLQKNVHNSIKKVATETSLNNRVELSFSSSQEFEETTSRKETIKIENPNVGRTVNYNFYQLQNIYETTTHLTDVKIVLNPGVEAIKSSGVADVQVFELEEFGKIYPNLDRESPHSVILAAIVARQVFKHYADFLPGVTRGNGAIKIKGDQHYKNELFHDLNFTSEIDITDNLSQALIEKLRVALSALQGIPFSFNEVVLDGSSVTAVNTGAYYLESEVGERPATEKYLEARRDLETEHKKAELEHLKEQTKKGIFFQDLPASVTHLNYPEKNTI